ncbi:hypothetical protein R3P38DRAFT_2810046 [Favolaschia claudopus]|uniref:Uncharacterized protein n=1 Tax=Favolaschia claudopus TaxID=2862362 RepID=A0AAV9ZBV3_9AGAR
MPVQLPDIPQALRDRMGAPLVASQDPPTQADVGRAASLKYQATLAEGYGEIDTASLGLVAAYEQKVTEAHNANLALDNTLTMENLRTMFREELDKKLDPLQEQLTTLERKVDKMAAQAERASEAQLTSKDFFSAAAYDS